METLEGQVVMGHPSQTNDNPRKTINANTIESDKQI